MILYIPEMLLWTVGAMFLLALFVFAYIGVICVFSLKNFTLWS